jgi:hypothetical protein
MSGCAHLQTAWVKVCNPILVLVGVFALEKQIIPAGQQRVDEQFATTERGGR